MRRSAARDFFDVQVAPIDVAFYSTYEDQNDGLLSAAIGHRLELAARVGRRAAAIRQRLPRHRDATRILQHSLAGLAFRDRVAL
jgi:hypothetical protein